MKRAMIRCRRQQQQQQQQPNNHYYRTSSSILTTISLGVLLFHLNARITHIWLVEGSSTTDTLIGLKGKDFILLAANTGLSNAGGVTFTSTNSINKIHIFQPADTKNQYEQQSDRIMTKAEFEQYHINRSTQQPYITPNSNALVPTIAVAMVGNYPDIDHIIRLLHAQYNIYQFEAMTYCHHTLRMNSADEVHVNYYDFVNCGPVTKRSTVSATRMSIPMVLSIHQMVYMIRNQISQQLRARQPLQIYTLVGTIVGKAKRHHIRQYLAQQPNKQSQLSSNSDIDTARTIAPSSTSLSQRLQHQVSKLSLSSISSKSEHPNVVEDDDDVTAVLYWLDEYGSMIGGAGTTMDTVSNDDTDRTTTVLSNRNFNQQRQDLPYGVHGYASDMIYSILDQKYKASITIHEAIHLMRECIEQIQKRYVINSGSHPEQQFCVKYIDRYGCIQIEL